MYHTAQTLADKELQKFWHTKLWWLLMQPNNFRNKPFGGWPLLSQINQSFVWYICKIPVSSYKQ